MRSFPQMLSLRLRRQRPLEARRFRTTGPLQGTKHFNVKREQANGSFYLLNQTFANNMSRKLMSVIGAVGKHSQERHALVGTGRKTKQGCREWHMYMAAAKWKEDLGKTSAVMADAEQLRYIGFSPASRELDTAQEWSRDLTSGDLKLLIYHLKLKPKPYPRTEFERLRELVKYALGDISEDYLLELMDIRGSKRPGPYRAEIDSAKVGLLDGAVDHDELDACKKLVACEYQAKGKFKAAAAARARAKASGGPKGKAHAAAGGPKPKAVPRRKVVLAGVTYSMKQVSAYMPNVPDCFARRDGAYHMRWQAHYPNDENPKSTSLSWNETERSCVIYCLKWVWWCHNRKCPTDLCPWDLDNA
jgi:hypothetical protein